MRNWRSEFRAVFAHIGVGILADNRKARRRAKALRRKRRGALLSERAVIAPISVVPLTIPQWRMALIGSSIFVTVSLSDGPAYAQCAPLTSGDDNVVCGGNLDGVNSDALAGNDTITISSTAIGFAGAATVDGGADNDSIVLSSGSILGRNAGAFGQVSGGLGDDTIVLTGSSHVGNNGDGVVSGGAGLDSIDISGATNIGHNAGSTGQVLGDAGADTISIAGSLIGRNGAATVDGGADNDEIVLTGSTIGFNASGPGQVLGGGGDDTITLTDSSFVGRAGSATVSGGADNDVIALSNGSNLGQLAAGTGQVLGEIGDDTITIDNSVIGLAGAATVDAGMGEDSIALSNGAHIGQDAGATGHVLGGAGADTITIAGVNIGDAGSATVSGGGDADLIAVSGASNLGASVTGTAQILGDAGADTITIDNSIIGSFGSGIVDGGTEGDSITLTNGVRLGDAGGATGDVFGGAGADTISLSGAIVGFSGNGSVDGGGDDDVIDLSGGSLLARNAGATGTVTGGLGADTITLASGSHVGNNGTGIVDGGGDNDSIALSASNLGQNAGSAGQVLGGAGDDTITAQNSFVGRNGSGEISGGADNDSIALSNASHIGFNTGVNGQVLGDIGADTISIENSFVGRSGAATVSGGDDGDQILLSANSHVGRYAGATGQVLGDAGADTITLDDSNVGYLGMATVDGGADGDTISLTNGSVIGVDASGAGFVFGGQGDDAISVDGSAIGFSGAGIVDGGADNDVITVSGRSVLGRNAGGSGQVLGDLGNDTILITDNSHVGNSGDGLVSGGDGNDSITLDNGTNIGHNAGSSGQVLGGVGNDTITITGFGAVGRQGSATVDAGVGDDLIILDTVASVGAQGEVLGGAGNDTIRIDDSVSFAAGSIVDGGADNDLLAFTVRNNDTINPGDFLNIERLEVSGTDRLTLAGAQTFSDSVTVNSGTLNIDGVLTTPQTNIADGARVFVSNNLFQTALINDGELRGGSGGDSLIFDPGTIIGAAAGSRGRVQGLGGADTITINGGVVGDLGAATVNSGSGDDSVSLTSGASLGLNAGASGLVFGSIGDDTIQLDGSDVGISGAGEVNGADGADSITLANGSDIGVNAGGAGQILGDLGDDFISVAGGSIGVGGSATVSGGEGLDTITVAAGGVIGELAGSSGQVLGDAGADTLILDGAIVGNLGAGIVSGGADDDMVMVSNGSSIGGLAGGNGQILGDSGDDTIAIERSNVGDAGAGVVAGGIGADAIVVTDNSIVGNLAGASGQVFGDAGSDTITLDGAMIGRFGDGLVSGGDDADVLSVNNSYIGFGSSGSGQILGDAGNDTITLNANTLSQFSAVVAGGMGDDQITASNNSVIGASGGSAAVGSGAQILGDAGSDTITVEESVLGDGAVGLVDGGDGDDRLEFVNSELGATVGGTGSVSGSVGADTIVIDNSSVGLGLGVSQVSGGEGDDSIILTNGSQFGAGASINGNDGDDTVSIDNIVATAPFSIDGGAGVDELNYMGPGDTTLLAGGISDFEVLTKDGAGVLTVDSVAEFNGATIVHEGTLDLVGGGSLSSLSVDVANGVLRTDGGGLDANTAVNVAGGLFDINGDEAISILNNNSLVDIASGATLSAGVINNQGGGDINVGDNATLNGTSGTINNAALINVGSGGAIIDAGDINNLAGGEIRFDGPGGVASLSSSGPNGIVNDGLIALTDGDLSFSGAITNQSTGVFDIVGGQAIADSAFTNDDGAQLIVSGGAFSGISTLTNNAATSVGVQVGAGATLSADTIVNNAGATFVSAGLVEAQFSNSGTVNASGVIDGVFNNQSGGVLAVTDSLSTGPFVNAGEIVFGDVTSDLFINGDFTQDQTGVINISIAGAESNTLIVSGDVNLDGALNFTSITGLAPGTTSITIIDGAGGLNGAFDMVSGLLISQDIEFDTANADILLNITLNSLDTVESLSVNQRNAGDNLFALFSDPSIDPELAAVAFAIGTLDTETEIAAALDQLHPESLDVGLKFLTTSQNNFLDLVIGNATGSASDASGVNVWGVLQASGVSQGERAENLGFDGTGFEFIAGLSGVGAGPVTLGIAGGYGEYNGETDGVLSNDVDAKLFRIGGSLHAEIGGGAREVNGYFDVAVGYAGGETSFVLNRPASGVALSVAQDGAVDILSVDVAARLTIDGYGAQEWPVSPYAEIGLSAIHQDAVLIGGSSAAALVVEELNQTRASTSVGVTYEHQWRDNIALQARVAGVHYFGDTQNAFTSRFASTPVGASTFQTFGREVERQIELDANLIYRHRSDFEFGVSLFGEAGDLNTYGARLGVSRRF